MLDTIKVEYYYAMLCLAEAFSFLSLGQQLLHYFIAYISFAFERDRMLLCVQGFQANLKSRYSPTSGDCTVPKCFTTAALLGTYLRLK